MYQDADALVSFVIQVTGVQLHRLIVIGRSLGTGPASHLGKTYSLGLLVLLSPLESIHSLVAHSYGSVAKLLIKNRFEVLKNASSFVSPTLIIHGKDDALIPIAHAQNIYGKLIASS